MVDPEGGSPGVPGAPGAVVADPPFRRRITSTAATAARTTRIRTITRIRPNPNGVDADEVALAVKATLTAWPAPDTSTLPVEVLSEYPATGIME
jgi:hypothetical protein